MAKQLENATTVVHFPLRPFGRHAGQREIVLTYGGPDVNADEIPPLNGCTLDDPLSDSDKARLCGLALARIDAGGRFDVDYAALRAHLRTLCGVRDEDLHGLTWGAAMSLLGEKSVSERPLPLSKAAVLIYEKLLTLRQHEAMLTSQIQDWYEEATGSNLDEGTWKNLRKEMEPYGLKNRPRVGYYIDQEMTL